MTLASEGELDFYSASRPELERILKKRLGAERFRAQQLFEWAYRRDVTDIDSMTNISKVLREELKGLFRFPKAKIIQRQISKDGTRKYLLEVSEGVVVETVLIKQPARMTLCVSSQVGCAMGCTFCQTGTMGFKKNLSAGDIVRQILAINEDAKNFGDSFHNLVFMGMGEPLHNFKGVTEALKILLDEQGLGIGPRKITVSSVGLVPMIERFGRLEFGVNLAVSLNATTNETRSAIMPVNRKFPLETLLKTLKAYPLSGRKKITIEYVMLHGFNDSEHDLDRLCNLLSGLKVKVNLIPYNNNVDLGYQTPPKKLVLRWNHVLNQRGLSATIRWSKGTDIDAGCGQLATKAEAAKAKKVPIGLEVLPDSVEAQSVDSQVLQ